MARLARTLLISAATVTLVAGAGGCSCSFGSKPQSNNKGKVESQIKAKMTDVNGNHPESVTCPGDLPTTVGAQLACKMTIKGQPYTVNVTVTSVQGSEVKFDMVKVPG